MVVVTSFGLFICFIGYFVVKINLDPALEHHLVTRRYYQEELKENEKIRARNNANQWRKKLKHHFSETELLLFPLPKNQTFKIQGYRPSNPQKDFTLFKNSEINAEQLTLDRRILDQGVWKLIVEWKKNEKTYRIEYELHH